MKSRWIGLIVFLSFTAIFFSLAAMSISRSGRFTLPGQMMTISCHFRRMRRLRL